MDRLFFEDLEVGMEFESVARTVTEDDVLDFARLSGDSHPIHVDAGYAAKTEFGQRIAHGPYGIALAIGLFGTFAPLRETAIVMTDISEWRFKTPIFIGDRLKLILKIGTKHLSKSGRGIVQRHFQLIKQDGTIAQEGTSAMVVLRRMQQPH